MSKIIKAENTIITGNEKDYKTCFDVWLSNYTSQNTRNAYLLAVKNFHSWLGHMRFADVTEQDVINYRDYLKETKSNASVNQKLAGIRGFYKYLFKKGKIAHNPADDVRGFKVKKFGKSKALNPDKNQDIDLLKSIDTTNEHGARDYAIIMVLLTTGLRVSALAKAKVTDMFKSGSDVKLQYINKGGEEKTKKLSTAAIQAIRDYLKFRVVTDHAPLFTTVRSKNSQYEDGKPMSRNAISMMIQKRAKKAGLEGITAHTLRHTTAMNLQKQGYSISTIQNELGHENPETTLIYLDHLTTDETDTIADTMNERYS